MLQPKRQRSGVGVIVRIIVMALLVFSFIAIVIVTAITLLTGDTLAGSPAVIRPQPGPTPTVAPLAAVTPRPRSN
ncbi:MAG: hypothetical protein HC875_03345 [Anaerolineales bacterium]|nr:hypothetical protein [Anaerolineales bacterium]